MLRLLATFLLVVAGLCVAPARAATRSLDQGWQVRLAPGDPAAKAHPRAARWLPAHVPGAVQTDLMAAGLLRDPWKGENERAAQWVGLADWQYRTTLMIDAATLASRQVDLVFEGLDTYASVRVNGTTVVTADNMYRSWRAAVRPLLRVGANRIEVDFASPIRKWLPTVLAQKNPLPGSYDSAFGDEPKGRQTAAYVRKAGYHYGWDWAPRIVTQGIWRAVRLEAYDGARLDTVHVQQVHLDDDAAVLEARVNIQSDRARTVDVQVRIGGPDGTQQTLDRRVTLFAGLNPVTLPIRIEKPRRWWPAGYGNPDLYAVVTRVSEGTNEIGRDTHRIGLRTVELRREKDRWGRSMAIVVNGVPIFAKGANLLPSDSFGARVDPERVNGVLEAAVAANMNLLRVWGGAYYLDEAACATADRLGLMIWQDFSFGGAVPPDDEAFRENTRLEAVEQVRRMRRHASVVMWVGNNEVQTAWEHWDDRKAFKAAMTPDQQEVFGAGIRRLFDNILRAVVRQESPGTPYFGGSPTTDYDGPAELTTDGDVHFWSVWSGAPLEDYLTTNTRFMSEFGLQSMPDMRTIAEFLAPARTTSVPVVLKDNGYDRGKGNGRILGYLRANYGEPRDFADYVYRTQLFQAEGIEMAVTHLRASRPQAMGSLYWTLNDSWPGQINSLWTGAAWGSIDYRNRWKALHYRARRFYAPVTIGAQRSKGVTSVTLISDKRDALPARWRLRVIDRDGRMLSDRGGPVTAAPLAAIALASLSDAELLGTADPKRTFAVAELVTGDAVVARNFVYFAHAKDLALTDPHIRTTLAPVSGGYALTLTAESLARGVWIDFGKLDVTLSDNTFDIAPGDRLTVVVKSSASLGALQRALTIRTLRGVEP
jgi:beta-mannosidase